LNDCNDGRNQANNKASFGARHDEFLRDWYTQDLAISGIILSAYKKECV
jgi:hypothetical protein